MRQSFQRVLRVSVCASALLVGTLVVARAQDDADDGWQIPATAAKETNPIAVNDKVLAKGKDLYKSKCQKCHGVSGKGDGPDADPKHKPGNLTDSSRASRNPDGVMFYKVWNGRPKPKMPAFKSEMSKDDVWTVIAYAKTLRQ
jgi:mono/diheme cytochrome c family protein